MAHILGAIVLGSLYLVMSGHHVSGGPYVVIAILPIPLLAVAWAIGWGGEGTDP